MVSKKMSMCPYKVGKVKIRKSWIIKPATKVEKSKRKKTRAKTKKELKEILENISDYF